MLEIGSKAPEMALEDTAGNAVRAANYQGNQSVLIYFMRSTSCPVCNRHVTDLAKHSAEFERTGVQVLIAVPEGREEAAAWSAARRFPFRVVTGQRGSPHEAIGLTRKVFGSMQQSGSIFIDPQGIIRHAHGATMPISSYDPKGIFRAIEATRATTIR